MSTVKGPLISLILTEAHMGATDVTSGEQGAQHILLGEACWDLPSMAKRVSFDVSGQSYTFMKGL